ncbi:hypothetical protein [Listeria cornellensis]|uniref:Uncharacterized protein n=1 Tax=Listeria cornellensis FSL F6-0969 TaxID=1265820 RepID=W7CIU1_9LIST|nr:hypothetical protein [Listeria cornellensis]EUJ32898.1 hypothetical protein PCORN_00385 [Listeria cornellensis FSL F6-0969]
MKEIVVKKRIPLLPAVSMEQTVKFYKELGFTNLYENEKRSGGYAIMDNGYIDFQIYAYKKLEIPTPTNMYLYGVENIDSLYDLFISNYKKINGKIPPRTGLPRVGIPKNLNADRRFSITDPNGNQFIFSQAYSHKKDHSNKTRFEKLYWKSNTLAYSHESPIEARKMLESAIKRADLQEESPAAIFQVYVLLTDVSLLLEDTKSAINYYSKATHWYEKMGHNTTEDLAESIEQYKRFAL